MTREIKPEVLDELLSGVSSPEDLMGDAGLFRQLKKALMERALGGFDDKIISLYARGLTVRGIQGHLRELYGTEVSPDLISRVTDAVLEEVKEWQLRPLDACYPIVFFDALRVKIRDEGLVRNK